MGTTGALHSATETIVGSDGIVLMQWGEGTLTDSQAGWRKGALYIKTDATDQKDTIYVNTGTATSSTWTVLDTVTA